MIESKLTLFKMQVRSVFGMFPTYGQLLSIGRCIKIVNPEREEIMKGIKRRRYSEAFKKRSCDACDGLKFMYLGVNTWTVPPG